MESEMVRVVSLSTTEISWEDTIKTQSSVSRYLNAIFNIIIVISWWPVHLSMFSWRVFFATVLHYLHSSQATGCLIFHIPVRIVNKIFHIPVRIVNKIFHIPVRIVNKIFHIPVRIVNKIICSERVINPVPRTIIKLSRNFNPFPNDTF